LVITWIKGSRREGSIKVDVRVHNTGGIGGVWKIGIDN
jgi:hypothetical protein